MVVLYDNASWTVERFIKTIKKDTGNMNGKVILDYRRGKAHFDGKSFPLVSLN